MTHDENKPPEPLWLAGRIDVGRRHILIGLAGAFMASLGRERVRAQSQGIGKCILTPEAGEGPFYLDPKLIRSDITSGKPGAPLELALQVVRLGDCATLSGARVDTWHADALGLYSGYANQGGVGNVSPETAVGQQYLRGTQFTDADGKVKFRTIYPSWYGGRTPHVHFKVFLGDTEVIASQIFFPDEINNEVFSKWAPYRDHVSKRKGFNHNDSIPEGVFSEVTRSDKAFLASALLVVAPRQGR
jgi:protocatechuate 3,4-dioxygenase beta subunit